MDTAKLCNVQEFESISGIVSPSLSIIYDKIIPLRVDKTLEVTLSRDSYEELEITILKTDFCLFKQASRNKIGLTEKEVKITIASLEPELSQLVIGIDRREDYNNEEVFQRLINNEQVKPVFAHPKNESQRNMNAKFVRVNWLEGSLLTGILTPSNLVSTIKQRLFSLMLIDHIKDSIKKIGFFFPLTSEQERQGSVPFPSNIKK